MKSFKEFISEAKAKLIDHGYKLELGHYEARKYTKSRGDNYSGWTVQHKHDRNSVSDPISKREHAIKVMRQWHNEDEANGRNKKFDEVEKHENELMKRLGR